MIFSRLPLAGELLFILDGFLEFQPSFHLKSSYFRSLPLAPDVSGALALPSSHGLEQRIGPFFQCPLLKAILLEDLPFDLSYVNGGVLIAVSSLSSGVSLQSESIDSPWWPLLVTSNFSPAPRARPLFLLSFSSVFPVNLPTCHPRFLAPGVFFTQPTVPHSSRNPVFFPSRTFWRGAFRGLFSALPVRTTCSRFHSLSFGTGNLGHLLQPAVCGCFQGFSDRLTSCFPMSDALPTFFCGGTFLYQGLHRSREAVAASFFLDLIQ